jgi:lysophospholipase L1-like esterase
MDLHQLGAGYGGHFWFGHTRQRDLRGGEMEFSGTWQLGSELHQWARVLVHIPDHGAHTRQATYVIDPGAGPRVARTILQRTMRNGWVSLGVFEISGKPSVTLSTVTDDGDYQVENGQTLPAKNEDIAFDAVAFAPLPAKPRDIVVALGDSFSSGEGSEIYDAETDFAPTNGRLRDGCHRSPVTWSRLATLPGSTAQVARRDLDWDPTLDYHLLACSGAFASHVLRNQNPTGLHGELRQLERNFLDDSTTLVTLSIGGNDALFMDTFLTCFQPGECHLRRESETAPTLDTVTRTRIQDEVGPRVETVLHEIHDAAPNARILLMGYPPLLNGRCGTLETLLSPDEAAWLDGLAPVLAARMAQATAQVNATEGTDVVTFVDPEPYFRGTGVCGSPSFINPPMVRTSVPSELIFSASQSLHPNLDGYGAYARAMTDALAALPR